VLPPDTERVWGFLKRQSGLGGFVLVGGSALALRLRHRLSEDLDLVWPERRLPATRLEALRRVADTTGVQFERQDDEATVQQFADAGLALEDYQQNYLVDGKVRVSFFAPEAPLIRVLERTSEATPRVATLPELFKTKCLVSAQRSKTRDWLDLYVLLRDHSFTLRDYRAAFIEAGVSAQCDTGLGRLCSGVPQKDDEGYAHLLPNAPTLAEMKTFFIAQRDQWEIQMAAEASRRHSGGKKST
jgi:hypothetical protein